MSLLKYRPAAFIVTYSIKNNKIYYLLLKRKLHWKGWEFPKGGIEKKEKILFAIKREIKEETGINLLKIKSFPKIKGKYKYEKQYLDRKGFVGQTYKLFLVEIPFSKKIKIDKKEHSNYQWLEFPKAIKKLTWPNQKKCLKIVSKYLSKI